MKRFGFLFVSCLMAWLTIVAQTGQFIPADRFSSSLINDLCQDRQGSLWIATDYGLNRFDGYAFQTFLHHPDDSTSLVDNMAVCLLADGADRLWVGTRMGLDCFDAATETFVHYRFPDGLTPRVSTLLRLHDGRIIVGTAGYGIYEIPEAPPSAPEGATILLPFESSSIVPPSGGEGGASRASGFYSRMYEDSKGRLWHSGFDETIVMEHNGRTQTFRSECGIPQAFVEQDGELLVVCLRGIMAYRDGHMQIADIDMSAVHGNDVIFWRAIVTATGNIYIGTRGSGLYSIAPGEHRRMEDMDISTTGVDIQTAKVSSMLFDAKGNLWLGCHRKGLVLVPLRREQFQDWSFEGQGLRLGSTISSVCEGDGGMTWATVQGVGIYGFNAKGRVVAHPQSPDAVEFIFRDRQRRYWVGSDNGLYAYDPLTGKSALRVTFDCDRFNDMTSDDEGNIYISTFSRGFCKYNTVTGELRNFSMSDANDSLRGRLCNNWILAMMPDRQGRLWLATSNGVSCYDPKGDTFRPFGWTQLLPATMCYSFCETSRGHILIGTDAGLYIYSPGMNEAVPFREGSGLVDKVVTYIVESNDGNLWCSTSMGIWQYDSLAHEFIGHIAGNGLTKKEFIMNVGMHTDDDRVFFGHNDGLTVFSPQQMKIGHSALSDTLHLTAIRVGDEFVNATTELNGVRVTDGRPVAGCSYLTLSYLDHTVTLAFSQYNFETAMNVCLEYRMNDDRWIRQPQGKNEILLAHLQPGTYRLEVRACQGGDCSPSKVVVITVRAPWYRSTIAYFLYALAILSILGAMAAMGRRRAMRQLDEEKMKFLINATHDIRSPLTIILAAVKKMKNQAPSGALDTIERNSQRILNLVNQILDVRKIDKQQMHLHCRETDMVQFTAGICKMFDFNAQERGIALTFRHDGIDRLPAWIDPSQFDKVVTNLLSNAFKYTKDGGEITVSLEVSGEGGEVRGYLGGDSNLPSLTSHSSPLTLQVTDTGSGLDPESIRHIFDRFYQGSNSRQQKIEGTGIGLNLCKMIVDMHHGTITAQNRSDGRQGSVFTVTLPLGTEHLKAEEMEVEAQVKAPLSSPEGETIPRPIVGEGPVPTCDGSADGSSADVGAGPVPARSGDGSPADVGAGPVPARSGDGSSADVGAGPVPARSGDGSSADVGAGPVPARKTIVAPSGAEGGASGSSGSSSSSRKRVLLVDDDEEIGLYIKQELGRYYKFCLCPNGKEGLKELLTNDYDLVVSDVMMPEMDGFTMLRMIKTNLNLSHLPVIMLTSKADVANRLEGLDRGADAYLAKPFDMDELHLTIKNLIKGRRHLKGKFSGAQQQRDKLEVPEVKGNDELLMERIMKVVNKNLNDSDFSVEMLCAEVGISRAQLHRKMKELTGLSTSEFIRNIRLEQAARLLKEQKINVTQVAYTVGFSNLAHFSTVFRKHFGVAPSDYASKESNPTS